jgi:hypothetical protein
MHYLRGKVKPKLDRTALFTRYIHYGTFFAQCYGFWREVFALLLHLCYQCYGAALVAL